MITPMKPCETNKSFFVVTDIENDPDGNVLKICTVWREDSVQCIRHNNWQEYTDWLFPLAETDSRFRAIYAHNGGGWDWLSLVNDLMNRKNRHAMSASTAGSKMITLSVLVSDRFTVTFSDSLYLLRSNLDSLGKQFVGRGKVVIDKLPHEILKENPALFDEYHYQDCLLLLEVMEKAIELIRENVAEIDTFGVTIGATAMKIYKTIGLKYPIEIPTCNVLKEKLRKGYRGGRVEVFKYGYFPKVNVYDINSLYPYVMKTTPVPTSARTSYVEDEKYRPGSVGVFYVTFNQYNRDVPAVLGEYEGCGHYFSPELNVLNQVGGSIHIIRGEVFLDTDYIFTDFVDRLYDLRIRYKGTAIDLLAKYILNSCYGKFGQKSLREMIACVDDFSQMFLLVNQTKKDGVISSEAINAELGIWKVKKQSRCSFEHVGIAGMITSAARAYLYKGMLAAGKGLIYVDTDSLHIVGNLDCKLVSPNIGHYKLEFSGEAVYAGKKLYGLRDKQSGIEKVRTKGVPVGGKFGSRVSFDDLCRVAKNEKIVCEFIQPATMRETFRGVQPCQFPKKPNRKRTIQKT